MTRGRWLTPDAQTGGDVCRQYVIPPELLPFVGYLLDKLAIPDNWELGGDMTIDETIAMVENFLSTNPQDCPTMDYPKHFIAHPLQMIWRNVNLISVSEFANAAYYGGFAYGQTTPAQNDQMTVYPTLSSGLYNIRWFAWRQSGAPQLRLYVDGVYSGEIDLYGSGVNKLEYGIGQVNFVTSGAHEVVLKAENKNPASSGYAIRMQLFWISPYET